MKVTRPPGRDPARIQSAVAAEANRSNPHGGRANEKAHSGSTPISLTMPLQRWYAKWGLKVTGSSWKAVVHPKVDPGRPYLFAHNHTNHFDFILMHNATPHYKQGVELEEHFKIPFYGWFCVKFEHILVSRDRASAALKKLVADQALDMMVLKDLLAKKF